MLVLLVYRPARKKLASADEREKAEGVKDMNRFVEVMVAVSKYLLEHGDVPASLLAWHNAASGAGWYDKQLQETMNWQVWLELQELDQSDPDVQFVASKVFFGLLENSTRFAAEISMEVWLQRVEHLFDAKYPDAPGRALRLARHLVGLAQRDEALALLNRALSEEVGLYGKSDQIKDITFGWCFFVLKRLIKV